MESKSSGDLEHRQPAADAGMRREERPSNARRLLFFLLDITLLGLVVVAVGFLLNPFPRWTEPPQIGMRLTLVQVLAYRDGSLVLGAALLGVVLVAGLFRLRWRVTHAAGMGRRICPRCGSADLRRIRRRWYHYFLGLLGIPVYRFVCGDCHWHGTRAFK